MVPVDVGQGDVGDVLRLMPDLSQLSAERLDPLSVFLLRRRIARGPHVVGDDAGVPDQRPLAGVVDQIAAVGQGGGGELALLVPEPLGAVVEQHAAIEDVELQLAPCRWSTRGGDADGRREHGGDG